MTQSITLSMQLDDAQRLRGTLDESWQTVHREGLRASFWDFTVAKSLQLGENLDLGWAITCREAIAGEISDLEERRQSLQTIFDQTIEATRLTCIKAREFEKATGHTIERLQALNDLVRELEDKREKYLFRLSLLDDGLLKEALAEQAAGHYATAAAALADLLAARHAEQITPPYTELRKWAEQSPPPPAWFKAADDPL